MPQRADNNLPRYGARARTSHTMPSTRSTASPRPRPGPPSYTTPGQSSPQEIARQLRDEVNRPLPENPSSGVGFGNMRILMRQVCAWLGLALAGSIAVFIVMSALTQNAPANGVSRLATRTHTASTVSTPAVETVAQSTAKESATPRITSVSVPKSISSNGRTVNGMVRFSDAQGDVIKADFSKHAGSFKSFSIDLPRNGAKLGAVHFMLRCQKPGDVTFRVTLVDSKGNRSVPQYITYLCDTPSRTTTTNVSKTWIKARVDFGSSTINVQVGDNLSFQFTFGKQKTNE